MQTSFTGFIVGNLGGEPTTRTSTSGREITRVSVAISEGSKDARTTTWVNLMIAGQPGLNFAKVCKKGASVRVTGPMRMRSWKDSKGITQQTLEMTVDRWDILRNPEDKVTTGTDTETDISAEEQALDSIS